MFVYDIILTFPQEVEKIWRRKFTGLTVLWFMVSNFAVATLLVLINNFARIGGYIYSQSLLYMMVRTQWFMVPAFFQLYQVILTRAGLRR